MGHSHRVPTPPRLFGANRPAFAAQGRGGPGRHVLRQSAHLRPELRQTESLVQPGPGNSRRKGTQTRGTSRHILFLFFKLNLRTVGHLSLAEWHTSLAVRAGMAIARSSIARSSVARGKE
eukprot:COSAG06_NODE_267_length_18822_cov_26.254607_1_plen_120_part_00